MIKIQEWKKNLTLTNSFCVGIVLLFCMTLISVLVNKRSIGEGMVFFLFQIGGVLLPGMALFYSLYIKKLTGIEHFLISYALGFCINIGIYFFTMCLGLKAYIKIIFFIAAVISLVVLLKKKPKMLKVPVKENVNIIILLGIVFAYTLIVFSKRWSLPVELKYYTSDLLYWVGDAVSLKEKFLPINYRTLEEGYKYHYFGAMQIAVMSMVTDIVTFDVAVVYSYIEGVILWGLSCYCVIKRFVKKSRSVSLTLFLMMFTSGIEAQTAVTYLWHIYLVPMSYNIALSLVLIVMILIHSQNRKKKLNKGILVFTVLFLMVATGMKGPTGAIILCLIGCYCIYWLFFRKKAKQAVVYGVYSVVAFGVVYFFLLADMNSKFVVFEQETVFVDTKKEYQLLVSNEPQELNIAEEDNSGQENETNNEEVVMGEGEIEENGIMLDKKEKSIGGYLEYCGKLNPWTFIPALLFFIIFSVQKKVQVIQVIYWAIIFIGTIFSYTLSYTGSSQMYFALTTFPFAALLAGIGYEEIEQLLEEKITNKKRTAAIIYGVIGCIFLFGWRTTLKWEYRQESARAWKVATQVEQTYTDGERVRLTSGEYKAYRWIRKNVEEDALILSDRALEAKERSLVPAVFSERHIYGYNAKDWVIYAGEESTQAYLKDKGIDYVIVTKRVSPYFEYKKSVLKRVYGNREISVYKVL